MVLYELILYKVYVRINTNHYMVVLTIQKLDNKMKDENHQEKMKNDQIKIFGTQTGVNIIESPIKARILSILEEKERSGAEIVSLTGKSKANDIYASPRSWGSGNNRF